MKNSPQAWERLAAAARSVPDERDVQAPFGFATRVAALAMAAERPAISLIERFSLRAMILACGLAVVAIAANYSSIRGLFQDQTQPSDDPVAEMVDLAS
jgi:hypothetical protein